MTHDQEIAIAMIFLLMALIGTVSHREPLNYPIGNITVQVSHVKPLNLNKREL